MQNSIQGAFINSDENITQIYPLHEQNKLLIDFFRLNLWLFHSTFHTLLVDSEVLIEEEKGHIAWKCLATRPVPPSLREGGKDTPKPSLSLTTGVIHLPFHLVFDIP